MRRSSIRPALRAFARHYPFLPYRRRLPLLNGSIDAIPNGAIVQTRDGLRVRVSRDWMYYDVYFWGDYEPYHTKIYRRLVREGDVVLDVGANFGWFTTHFARWVGTTGRVHSFEPVEHIHALAAETLELNALSGRVQLNDHGLGRETGSITIFTFAGLPHGHATAVELGRDDAVPNPCSIRRLDDYCEDHGLGPISFMKVDVEGFEPDVFLGGERLLSSPDAPVIGFEINRELLSRRGLTPADAIDPLRAFGYESFYSFSTRTGVTRLTSDFAGGECLAGKTGRMPELGRAARAGRLFR